MIYTDGIHIISDTSIDELHIFAEKISFKLEWFQNNNRHPHYDITTSKAKNRVIKAGAILISSKKLLKIIHNNLIKGQ